MNQQNQPDPIQAERQNLAAESQAQDALGAALTQLLAEHPPSRAIGAALISAVVRAKYAGIPREAFLQSVAACFDAVQVQNVQAAPGTQ